MQCTMMQSVLHLILLAFLLLHSTKATSSSLRCEKKIDFFLECSCRYDDYSDCAADLFTGQDFSEISKFYIKCDNGNLSLAYFTQLAEGVMLTDLTIVQCELTDWHRTVTLPAALAGLKNLTITQSFSANIFPSFGDLFENLESFTFYDNYLHLNYYYYYIHHPIPYVQQFNFKLENAVVCINQSDVLERIGALNALEFPMHDRSCFCTVVYSAVQMYCFGAHAVDLKNALSAVVSMPQYTNPIENRTIISAIYLHNLQFLVNDYPDSDFEAILSKTVPGTDLTNLRNSATHPFIFHLDTCDQSDNITNFNDAWKELQELLCPLVHMTANATKVSVVNCPHANALQLSDNVLFASPGRCGMLQWYNLQYLDLSNNNITMEQYEEHFLYQLQNSNFTIFNFSGNSLRILKPMFFYLINPSNLRYVDLSFSNLNVIEDNPFEHLLSVEWISLAGNTLQYVQHYWFRNLLTLKHLDLSTNYRFYGVWGPTRTYPQIWPESLEHLDLSGTMLVDADDRGGYIGKYGQRFTDKFFMGLSNLLVLNLSNTLLVLNAELFKPLRSLEVLDLTGSYRDLETTQIIPNDLLKYLTGLRSLHMGEVLPRRNEIYKAPWEFFKFTAILCELDLKRNAFKNSNYNLHYNQDYPPECVYLLRLYRWVLWKKRGTANFTFLEDNKLLCTYNNITYSFADIQDLLANNSGVFNLSSMFCEAPLSTIAKAIPIENRSRPDPGSPQPSQWTQTRLPLFVCLATIFVVISLCIPTRVMLPAFLHENHDAGNQRNSMFNSVKSKFKHVSRKRKILKQMFFQETLINGFMLAYQSKWIIEKLAWYVVLLAFTGILTFQIIGLWQQYYYSDPITQSTMVSAAKFPQNNFTICFPVGKRNHLELTRSDVYALAEKPMCDQQIDLSLPIRDALLRDTLMFRIGAQMAWEGATLNQNLAITEAMKAMDDIVFERNLSYRHLLTEINGILCEVMQFTASMRGIDSTENGQITVNPAGCSHLLQKKGFGLTWYDLIDTNTACIRFPGLFNFSGYQHEGVLQFQPWQYFYNTTPAKIDLGGYEYPLAAGQNSFPARAYLHHDTSMVLQLKSVFRNLESYRLKTNRCYKNCIGTKRVKEIQTKCNCRPLMFADLSDPTLPDCTLDIYEKCGLSKNGDLKDCAEAVPCELWDFTVQATDDGLTSDNSTIIRFGGMNTLYVVYEEQDARTAINFMGDVGGVFGLWLGGSMVAIVHIFFFCLKSIYVLVPGYRARKISEEGKRTASVYTQTANSKLRPRSNYRMCST